MAMNPRAPAWVKSAFSRLRRWHSGATMNRPYIGYIEISQAMAVKIVAKHGISPEEVRDACQSPNRYRHATWNDHPDYGRRLYVVGETRTGRLIKVILQPIDQSDGTWRLRTALAGTRKDSA